MSWLSSIGITKSNLCEKPCWAKRRWRWKVCQRDEKKSSWISRRSHAMRSTADEPNDADHAGEVGDLQIHPGRTSSLRRSGSSCPPFDLGTCQLHPTDALRANRSWQIHSSISHYRAL